MTDLHPLLHSLPSRTKPFMVYVAGNEADSIIPRDGSYVTSTVKGFLLTSRGSIKLVSIDPATLLLFDLN